MKKLWKYIKPYKWFIILTMGIKLLGAVFELLIPYFMEIILDDVVPDGRLKSVFLYGGLMLLCAAGCLMANVGANRMSAISSGRITLRLRHDLFEKMEQLSVGQMDELTVSSAQSRLTSDTYNINQLLARMQRIGVRAPILLLGGVVMMLGMDGILSLVIIGMLPVIGLIVYFVTKKSVPLYKKEQTVLDSVVCILKENITGIRVIKALSKTEYERKRFDNVNRELTSVDQRVGRITAITNPATSLVLNLGLTFVVLIGAFRVNFGNCKSGVIIAFLQYFVMILNAMLSITRIFVMWSKGEASANRVADIFDIPRDFDILNTEDSNIEEDNGTEKHNNTEEHNNIEAPHIEFKNVTFSYRGIGTNICHLSFKLKHGESLGILGETGSGKTTVLNLLMGFYDPNEGTVLIGGKDIRGFSLDELRAKFGAVFQNDFIMEGSIKENISFFRDINEECVIKAVEDAQASEFISKHKDGLSASVDVRGNNLSGGQRQRLLIGRALAARPEILLLDDASSALDYRTDSRLLRALKRNYHDTTTIIVAQRISSICNCTHILVLSEGNAVGYGTHEELMNSCNEYRNIAELQMGKEREMA